jgi:hypothetical protein
MDFTFIIVMGGLSVLAWHMGFRLGAVALGVASVMALAPSLAGHAGRAVARVAGIPSVGMGLNAGLTLLVCITGCLVLLGWRPKRRR